MNSEWQHFLDNLDLAGGEAGVSDAADRTLASDLVVAAVPDEVVLRITGDDAEAFLQGQFSNDVAALSDPSSQLTTWSTPKGRVLALFRLYRVGNEYRIRLPAALTENFIKRLRMYVLMSKVTIEEQTDFVSFGLSGAGADSTINRVLEQEPKHIDECVYVDDVLVTRVRGNVPRYEITAPSAGAKDLWQRLSDDAIGCNESIWRLQNIDAGVPWIGSATSEAFVLQMLNLQHIDGVSFKKGCFPGQEVVARMQYLGKLKRRMYLLCGEASDGVPLAGDELFSEGKSSAIGKVVDAQAAGDGSYRMLAVCAIDAMEQPVYVGADATGAVTQMELPYSIEAA